MAKRRLADDVAHTPTLGAATDGEDEARPVSSADEDVFRPRGAVHEIPLPKEPLLSLHDHEALAGEDEEVFLRAFCVVHAVRLSGSEDPEVDPDLIEPSLLAVEHRVETELALEPAQVAGVDDEPAIPRGKETDIVPLERCLRNHAL